jgi:hypothetical protein
MHPGCREWDEQMLNECMYPHDMAEVLKIRLSERLQSDHIAWFYDRTGIFTVRSACKLAMEVDRRTTDQAGSSSRTDGSKPMYADIWKAKVLAKVHIFAWRLSQEGMATQANRRARKLEKEAKCQLCNREDEMGHHVVVWCTKAQALRRELRNHWCLPDECYAQWTGPDWLLTLMSMLSQDQVTKTLLLLWRAWFLRNDAIHGKGTTTVNALVEFLTSYAATLNIATQAERGDPSDKGKNIIHERVIAHRSKSGKKKKADTSRWCAPLAGWVKLNADAGFRSTNGDASTGKVLLTTWQSLMNVDSVEAVEAKACLHGVLLAAEWFRQPPQVELDCAVLVNELEGNGANRSHMVGVLAEIKEASTLLPACRFMHIQRGANQVAHALARLALQTRCAKVMRFQAPKEVQALVDRDNQESSKRTSTCNSNPI